MARRRRPAGRACRTRLRGGGDEPAVLYGGPWLPGSKRTAALEPNWDLPRLAATPLAVQVTKRRMS